MRPEPVFLSTFLEVNAQKDCDVLNLRRKNAALQARIDALMLEYCPDEMTEEQSKRWALYQRPVSDSEPKK